MQRHGIRDGQLHSKSWDELVDHHFDIVITVCDQAAGEDCPNFLGPVEKLHWSTPDPAKTDGSEADIDCAFDNAYRSLKDKIENVLL